MKKLFIIGNGFDIAHNLPTSYENFRKYLCNEYLDGRDVLEDEISEVPISVLGPKGDDIYDMEEVADFLIRLISYSEPDGSKWSDVEKSLGFLDYEPSFDTLPELFDEDGDRDYFKESYNNEDMASNLLNVVPHIKEFFTEWVHTIDIEGAEQKESFKKLIGSEDLFLSFNYTETLERLYGIDRERVCHIHGKQGKDILFGHGNAEDHTERYMKNNIGSEDALMELHNVLRKDTEEALSSNAKFFNSIDETVKAVYSLGFSFADVDLIYIREICIRLPKNAVWYLNDFCPEDIPIFEGKLRECGFKGEIKTFSI